MSAVVVELVPNLWECSGESINQMEMTRGRLSIYAAWDRKRSSVAPHVYTTLNDGSCHIGINLTPNQARDLSEQLVSAADQCDAHAALLVAEEEKGVPT